VTPSDPVDPIKPSAAPQKPTFWHWLALLLIAVGVGRFWGRRGRNPVKDWQGVAEGMEEELERERLRSAVAQGQAMRERDALRHELSKANPQRNTEDLRQIAQLEDRLQRLGKRWLRQRGDLEREAEVSRRDATRFLAPLQQLGIMLRQIERRMRAVDEADFAQKVQQRRLGLQAFEGRLRDHFSGVVMLDERSWQNCRDELDELLASSLATAEEEAPNEAESGQAKSRRLQVLRGGR